MLGADWGLRGEGAGDACRPPQPSGSSTSGPHPARSEPAPQLPPSQLWMMRGHSKASPQTEPSRCAALRHVLPSLGAPGPAGDSRPAPAPLPSPSPGRSGRRSPPPRKPSLLGSRKSHFHAESARSRQPCSPGQPASSTLCSTPRARAHPGTPLPGLPPLCMGSPKADEGYGAGAAEVRAGGCQTQAGSRVSARLRVSTRRAFHPALAAEG